MNWAVKSNKSSLLYHRIKLAHKWQKVSKNVFVVFWNFRIKKLIFLCSFPCILVSTYVLDLYNFCSIFLNIYNILIFFNFLKFDSICTPYDFSQITFFLYYQPKTNNHSQLAYFTWKKLENKNASNSQKNIKKH